MRKEMWEIKFGCEPLPRCSYCKHYYKEVTDEIKCEVLHFCQGDLIFPEILDVCSEEDLFEKKCLNCKDCNCNE